jgi:microcystin-dependent protein
MGNSYTRQSSAEIVDGNIVEATPINNEFNALQSAFDGTLGHTHDGTVGEGPKINLTNSITGVLPVVNGGTGGIDKVDATTAPTANDDANDGYAVGSRWIDTTSDLMYTCLDSTPSAAIWRRFQPYNTALNSIAGQTTSADKMIYTTASDTYAVTPLTAYARSILDDADASTAQTTLGISTYIKTLLDDADASTAQTTLGVSTYIKTLLDDADAGTARTTLGLGSIATQNSNSVSITGGSVSGITDITVADGGTGASDAATARTNLGLGTMSTQNANSVAITGGTITGGTITGITDIALTDGGTGASDAANARTNLDVYSKAETIANAAPAGIVAAFGGSTAPSNWLECDGSTISRTTYAALFAAIGTTYGAGDGSTTFKIPDLRGEFIRGWDHSKGTDSGRAIGTSQTSQNLAHNHAITDPGHAHGYSDPGHAHQVGASYIGSGTGSNGGYITASGTGAVTTTVGVGITIAAAGTGISIQNNGGTEARPRNIALMYIIKT